MKVYLAGKMNEKQGSWRDAILGRSYHRELERYVPRWEAVRRIDDDYDGDDLKVVCWPKAPNRHVAGLHEYIGPYRLTYGPSQPLSKHAGYFHGSTAQGQHGMMDDDQQSRIVALCRQGIKDADLVFAWINSPDCFGTLAEIGYARALGKYVAVVISEDAAWHDSDYWFVAELADSVEYDTIYNRRDGEDEGERAKQFFLGAIVRWTSILTVSPLALVPTGSIPNGPEREIAQSFSQIARWSSDPRVRNEAQRMLKRITG